MGDVSEASLLHLVQWGEEVVGVLGDEVDIIKVDDDGCWAVFVGVVHYIVCWEGLNLQGRNGVEVLLDGMKCGQGNIEGEVLCVRV